MKFKNCNMRTIVTSLFLVILICVPTSLIKGQGFEEWSKDIGGDDTEHFKAILETPDGGFIIVGYIEPFDRQDHDLYVVKTDNLGDVEWDLTYGDSRDDDAYSVAITDDGYLVAGGTKSFGAGLTDLWLLKVDKQGEIVWEKTIGGEKDEAAYSIINSNGDFLMAGNTASYGAGSSDAWLLKVNGDGEVLWNITLGGTGSDLANEIISTSDNGLVLVGETSSYGAGWSDVWLVKLDHEGVVSWNKTYGGSSNDVGKSVIETDDGFVIVGNSESFGDSLADGYIVYVGLNGDLVWEKTYGGASDDYLESIAQYSDHDFIVVGFTSSTGTGESDVWVFSISPTGDLLEETFYGGDLRDRMYQIVPTSDGGYIIVGFTWSYGSTGNGYLIKLTTQEPETEPEPEPEPEPEQEPEEETSDGGGIPGFTVWSIALGLAAITLLLYIRKQ